LFATILTIVALSSIGLPGTNGFVAEFLVMIGAFRTYPILTVLSATGVILAAAYLLWALQRMIYNKLDKPANKALPDLNWRELGLLVPILVGILWLGVYPKPVLDRMEASAQKLVEDVGRNAERQRASMMLGGR
jgi:NADH-quinone oxidoreductase subunit M